MLRLLADSARRWVGARAYDLTQPLVFALVGGLVVLPMGRCLASDGLNVIRVAETWEVTLNSPSANDGAPQLTFLISPTGSSNGLYGILAFNQRDGAVGGLQLQLWHGETLLTKSTFANTSTLNTNGEVIRWTTEIEVKNGAFKMSIKNLTSTTWGNFDTDEVALAASTATTLSNLNSYDPNISLANTGIDFGSTRVAKLGLKQVKTVTEDEKVTEHLSSEQVLYEYP